MLPWISWHNTEGYWELWLPTDAPPSGPPLEATIRHSLADIEHMLDWMENHERMHDEAQAHDQED